MHPYLPHLLQDIENAKRPGFPDNHPFFSSYEPEEDEDDDDESDDWESQMDDLSNESSTYELKDRKATDDDLLRDVEKTTSAGSEDESAGSREEISEEEENELEVNNAADELLENEDFEDDSEDDSADEKEDNLQETFAEVERFVSGMPPPLNFGGHCGLKVADFPPAEQLSEEDMKELIKAYRKMGVTWNIDFCFPKKLPTVQHYNILINTLNERIMIMKNGFTGMDYCSGNPDGCKFGEYCKCLEYWNEKTEDIS